MHWKKFLKVPKKILLKFNIPFLIMIEIITFHKSTNYGALLQSLSLKEFLFSPDPIRKNKIQTFLNIFNLNDRVFTDKIENKFIDYNFCKNKWTIMS